MADKLRGRKKNLVKLPKGTVLSDLAKTRWELQEPIGEGGFGVIYNVKKVGSSCGKKEVAYAAKVEPHGNGPLFVEKNFFLRHLKPEQLNEYKRKKKLSFLGLPEYIIGGSYTQDEVSFRFLIMERFGETIDKRLKSSNTLNISLLGLFCSQIIDSLMYIHDVGYVHMDIKPENLLLKYNSKDDRVYLIDFGVIDKCTTDAEFKPDKKKQHNGTLMYSSRDSHCGVGTKRGDLEVLGYNIIKWFDVKLPWVGDIKTPAVVHEKKIDFMKNIRSELQNKVPNNIINYLTYVDNLKHNQTPDYEYVKSLLTNSDGVLKQATSQKRKTNTVVTSPPKRGIINGNVGNKVTSLKEMATSSSRSRKPKPDDIENDARCVKVESSLRTTRRKVN